MRTQEAIQKMPYYEKYSGNFGEMEVIRIITTVKENWSIKEVRAWYQAMRKLILMLHTAC